MESRSKNPQTTDTKIRNEKKCALCSVFLRKISGRTKVITSESELETIKNSFEREDLQLGDELCHLCNSKLAKHISKTKNPDNTSSNTVNQIPNVAESMSQLSTDSSSQSVTESPEFELTLKETENRETIILPIQRTVSTHKYCFICGFDKKSNMITVPFEARIQVYTKTKILIPYSNRCCPDHMIGKRFYDDELKKIKVYSTTSEIDVQELPKLLGEMSLKADESLLDTAADFVMPEKKLKALTGLCWEGLIALRERLSSLRNSSTRTITQALVIFLFKMRSGNSNSIIAAVFEMDREQQVSDFCHSVFSSFETDILPKNFGLENADRNDLVQNKTSCMAKLLHPDDHLTLICDGTYIRHEKSSNNEYQRKSFSGQKKVPLCKPFTICTTNGYVVDQLGPYLANKNDATILKEILEEKKEVLQGLLKKGDRFVLDRGFRDIKDTLEGMGYVVLMPALKGTKSQLTTEESNATRFVTKLRWVVEAVHGIQKKKFRLLDHKLDNKMLPGTGTYCRIACYLNNSFGNTLDSDVDMREEIFEAMQSRNETKNSLAEEVELKRWSRRTLPFVKVTSSDFPDFPEMNEKDLKILFTGSYQLKQTVSYLAEMLDSANNLSIGHCKEKENLIKVNVQSRHISKRIYKCFVEYRPNSTGYKSILRYCCDCANGSRTVGCCAHVAAVIYYLSHGRYLSKIMKPAVILSKMFLKDNTEVCINEESDEDE